MTGIMISPGGTSSPNRATGVKGIATDLLGINEWGEQEFRTWTNNGRQLGVVVE